MRTRSNPGNRLQYKRVNGPFTLYMVAGGGNKLPYGNLPRLILAWVCTEAVRTQNRVLILGQSLSKFMRTLGINSDRGFAERPDRAIQAAEDFTDRNQPAALTLHGLFFHVPQTLQWAIELIVDKSIQQRRTAIPDLQFRGVVGLLFLEPGSFVQPVQKRIIFVG